MESNGVQQSLETIHPTVLLLYTVVMLCFTMFVMQPVYVAISLVSGCIVHGTLKGFRRTGARLSWQIPLICIIALFNALITQLGTTVLVSAGPIRITLESLCYGITMGCALVAVMLWLEIGATLVREDALMEVFGKRFPTLTTMLTVVLQLVPQLCRRFRLAVGLSDACSASHAHHPSRKRAQVLAGGILLSWSLEDSLERSDAMRARGWGIADTRSSYHNWRFTDRDAACIAVVIIFGILNAICTVAAVGPWKFYPVMPQLRLWWGYVPYLILCLFPLIPVAIDAYAWRDVRNE